MELNRIATGIKLVGTTIKEISVENNIVNVQKEAKRSFGLNINEPSFENIDEGLFSQMAIDFEVEIEQTDGAAALISIARGKIESITSNIFDSGKVVIPFVNVIDYYKGLSE